MTRAETWALCTVRGRRVQRRLLTVDAYVGVGRVAPGPSGIATSLAETAAVLGIHRNTAAARISKIQHLLGVDLANPDERLALHLASRTTKT